MPEPAVEPHPVPPAPAGPSPTAAAFVDAFGGTRGIVDGALPALVLVVVNAVLQAVRGGDKPPLAPALLAAVATGVVIVAVRLLRRQRVQQAVSGFLGVALAAWFAHRSGQARGFFLPGIVINLAYGLLFLASAAVRRPLVGVVVAAVEGLDGRWRQDRALRRRFGWATAGWGLGVFGLRAAVQGALYAADRPGWLAVSRLLLGWPLTALAAVLTLWAVRAPARALRDAGGTAAPLPAVAGVAPPG